MRHQIVPREPSDIARIGMFGRSGNCCAARSASERTNSYNQEVIARAHPLRMRGLKAFRFAGAMRTLAQLLRRALTFVLDATYTLSKTGVART